MPRCADEHRRRLVVACHLGAHDGTGCGVVDDSGLARWLPLLATGLLARFDVVTVGEHFAFLSSTPSLVLFCIATILEVTTDKVPALDHALDVFSTLLRPVAGTVLSAAVMWQVNDPLIALGLGLVVGAPTAAGARLPQKP
jgi:hypothetical protein